MAVPTSISDLDAVAANNSPAGSDSIGTSLDDYLRSHAAIIKQESVNRLTATETLTNKTITSPTITSPTITSPTVTASKNDKLQIGVSATATQNFTLTAEAADGTMKLARGNAGSTTQDIATVKTDNTVDFTVGIFGFSYLAAANGYIKLPVWLGSLVIQWGSGATNASGVASITLPMPLTNRPYAVTTVAVGAHSTMCLFASSNTAIQLNSPTAAVVNFNWIAIGN